MGHRIKALVYNGEILASNNGSCITRVLYNREVIWPDTPAPEPTNLVIATYNDTVATFDGVKAGYWERLFGAISSGNKIKRIMFNGEKIYPVENDYLSIEKDSNILSGANGFADTNTIYTNLTFTIK
ncbi:hypothetical protein KNV38_gp003 [uncultured phage cr111_1]|uniref:Uncharacterized protein n=1 Tax=uncultured phage cr111_1 TaxID=2772071 RepID=A0A7M1RXE6_9CAUD|nr:hypothetical protein KNV38_gp003 [uncultured phage cr111_1]QOR59123.1 hypothetical protein [uncultured phage cr111_1]